MEKSQNLMRLELQLGQEMGFHLNHYLRIRESNPRMEESYAGKLVYKSLAKKLKINTKINCVALADDITILANSVYMAVIQINILL